MDRERLARWLQDYVEAWVTYDRAKIADLFSEEVSYRYHPYDEPVIGRDTLVESWLDEPDTPGTYEGHYEPIAIDGDIAVAVGHSSYRRADGSVDVYDNCFVMRFDAAGRCSTFTEWYIKRG